MQLMVVGMHRSGTSMLARLLNLMGAYFAPEGTGTGANRENPKGFWERRDVRAINDFVLHSAGCDWNRVSAFDVSRIPASILEEFQTRASRVVLEMDASRPWLLKEPRFCLLLPLWRRVLEAPVCIHILRHPVEVAASLRTRNEIPMDAGLALWEVYNRSAYQGMDGLPQVHVVHRDLVRDPVRTVAGLHRQLESLGVRRLSLPSAAEVESFVSPDLYREREGAAGLSDFSQATQVGLFEQWCGKGCVSQAIDVSPIERGKLAAYETSLPPLIVPQKAADGTAAESELRSKAAAAERQVQALKVQEQQAQALLRQREQHLSFLEREFASLREVHASREQAASELLVFVKKLLENQDVGTRLDQQLKAVRNELASSREEISRLQRELAQARDALAKERQIGERMAREREAAERAGSETGKKLDSLRAEAAKQAEEMVTLARLLLTTNSALGSVTTERDALRLEHAAALARHEQDLADASKLRAELERRLNASLLQHAQELAAASTLRLELERELATRDSRISALLAAASACGTDMDRLDHQLRSIRGSASWRLTAPIRRARRLFGRASAHPTADTGVEALRQSPWFDADWYAAQHPDVAASGLSPEVHFLVRGAAQAANPSPNFDTRYYLEQNPDVAMAGQNPLLHFIQFGEAEGRLPVPGDSNR